MTGTDTQTSVIPNRAPSPVRNLLLLSAVAPAETWEPQTPPPPILTSDH